MSDSPISETASPPARPADDHDGINRSLISTALVEWFQSHARDLPWRQVRGGYPALVSEAMLQQTQVSRVIDRFTAFMARFPTVGELARADEQDVLAHWQGLGYYRRARHLHAAAKQIVREHNGEVPRSAEALADLPGVGRYTAGAIASICFGERVPIVDGNVERVLTRWFAHRESSGRNALRRWAWAQAEQIVETANNPGMTNEALMELGALICTPRKPACENCPVASYCAARRQGLQDVIPEAKPATRQQAVHHHAVIIHRGRRVLLEQRPADGLWASMWQTPTIESARPLRLAEVRRCLPVAVDKLTRLDAFVHMTTHRRITFHVFTAASRARKGTWREPAELSSLPLSAPQHRILGMANTVRPGGGST